MGRSPVSTTGGDRLVTAEDQRSLDRLWEEFRVVRHDFRNLEASAKLAVETATHLDDVVAGMDERVKRIEALAAMFRVSEMAPREMGVLPEMSRKHIDRGDDELIRDRKAERRLVWLAAGGTAMQALIAIIGWVSTHHW